MSFTHKFFQSFLYKKRGVKDIILLLNLISEYYLLFILILFIITFCVIVILSKADPVYYKQLSPDGLYNIFSFAHSYYRDWNMEWLRRLAEYEMESRDETVQGFA